MRSNRDTRSVLIVTAILGSICFALGVCAARAATCSPMRTCVSAADTNCATPTPVIHWDASAPASAPIAGYSIYYREPGGTYSLLVDLPCDWYDSDADDVLDSPSCRGVDFGAAIQRYCPSCVPLTAYEFAVKAYDIVGRRSVSYSNTLSVCLSPLCAIRSGPCQ